MNLDYFINKLSSTKPDKKLFLKESGLSEEDYDSIINEFVIPKRNNKQIVKEETGIIGEIIANYKSYCIHFGDYGFLDKIIEWNDMYLFAATSGLLLGFEKGQSEIIEVDIEEEYYEINMVASDSASLLEMVIFLSQVKSNEYCGLFNNVEKEQLIDKCIELTGGDKSFYERLI